MPTKIEWAEETWNPVVGCSKVSEGCRNCYAIRDARRLAGNPNAKIRAVYDGLTVIEGGRPNWSGEVRLVWERLEIPLRRKKPTRWFVNSMSDLFHEKLPDEAIDRVFAVMALCPQHTFQVLTKRPERMLQWAKSLEAVAAEHAPFTKRSVFQGGIYGTTDGAFTAAQVLNLRWLKAGGGRAFPNHPWPLPNVWLGVSVEDQATADKRIPLLLQTPAAVRFVSYEPALGPVDFNPFLPMPPGESWSYEVCHAIGSVDPYLDWIIAGGESGRGARPAEAEWFRAVRDQCVAAGVPFFFKQWGEWSPEGRVGKKAAGRLLDGEIWEQMPVA
jgi:protein gp37